MEYWLGQLTKPIIVVIISIISTIIPTTRKKANLTWIPTQNNHKMPTMDKCKEKIRGMGVVVPKIIIHNLLREITINIKEGMKSNHL